MELMMNLNMLICEPSLRAQRS